MASNYTLESLINDLKSNSYVPKTEDELQGIAGRRYESVYSQKKLDAQQAYDTTNLALQRQLDTLGVAYGKQQQASENAYNKAYSQAGNQALSKGMQRSSYTGATLGGIAVAKNKAAQEITDAERLAKGGVEDQQTLLARQLAQQLNQYSGAQAADTLAYLDELEGREYERGTEADRYQNSLAMQVYQFANQEEQQDRTYQQWLTQFNEGVRQFDTGLAEQIRQYNENLQLNREQAETQ